MLGGPLSYGVGGGELHPSSTRSNQSDLAGLDEFDFSMAMSPAGTPMSQMSPTASQLVQIADQFRDGQISDAERAMMKNAVLSQLNR